MLLNSGVRLREDTNSNQLMLNALSNCRRVEGRSTVGGKSQFYNSMSLSNTPLQEKEVSTPNNFIGKSMILDQHHNQSQSMFKLNP